MSSPNFAGKRLFSSRLAKSIFALLSVGLLVGAAMLVNVVNVRAAQAPYQVSISQEHLVANVNLNISSIQGPVSIYSISNSTPNWYEIHVTNTSGVHTEKTHTDSIWEHFGLLPPSSSILLKSTFSGPNQHVTVTLNPKSPLILGIYTLDFILNVAPLAKSTFNGGGIETLKPEDFDSIIKTLQRLKQFKELEDSLNTALDPNASVSDASEALVKFYDTLHELFNTPSAYKVLAAAFGKLLHSLGSKASEDIIEQIGKSISTPAFILQAGAEGLILLNHLLFAFVSVKSQGGLPTIHIDSTPQSSPGPIPTSTPTQCTGTGTVSSNPAQSFEVWLDSNGLRTNPISPQEAYDMMIGSHFTFPDAQTATFTPGPNANVPDLPVGQGLPSQIGGSLIVINTAAGTILDFTINTVINHLGAIGYPSSTQIVISGHLDLSTNLATISFQVGTVWNPFLQHEVSILMTQTFQCQ